MLGRHSVGKVISLQTWGHDVQPCNPCKMSTLVTCVCNSCFREIEIGGCRGGGGLWARKTRLTGDFQARVRTCLTVVDGMGTVTWGCSVDVHLWTHTYTHVYLHTDEQTYNMHAYTVKGHRKEERIKWKGQRRKERKIQCKVFYRKLGTVNKVISGW